MGDYDLGAKIGPHDPKAIVIHPGGTVTSWQDGHVNPKVYKVEDGHSWKESQWPSLRESGQCDLCTAPEHLHMQAQP